MNAAQRTQAAELVFEVAVDEAAAAERAATYIADAARAAVRRQGRFALAVSGGRTPRRVWEILVKLELPWRQVHLAQVDERLASVASGARNFSTLEQDLLKYVPLPPQQIYPMPVDTADACAAARSYAQLLQKHLGTPPVFDLVHLGLGADGHTASLTPGDPVLDVADRDVALSCIYQGWRRMTLTFPILNRALRILWLVTGAHKADAVARLKAGDQTLPGARIRRAGAVVIADRAAAHLVGERP